MKIALHDADQTSYPNLALMKLANVHKAKGDDVSIYESILRGTYDRVYSSKVFTYTKNDPYLTGTIIQGGLGYDIGATLSESTEHICPDYSFYNLDYSLGFLTRGCSRKCKHCFVPAKEGGIKAHADIEEFARHKDVVLMDNNVLAHDHGIEHLEKIARLGLKIDFNQGLDVRLIDDAIARRLSKIKWRSPIRLACDNDGQMKHVHRAVELLRWHNATPRNYFCYVLVKDIPSALERIRFLKGLNVDPFAQPYRDAEGTPPSDEQRRFARWVNHKARFKSQTWEEYSGK